MVRVGWLTISQPTTLNLLACKARDCVRRMHNLSQGHVPIHKIVNLLAWYATCDLVKALRAKQ